MAHGFQNYIYSPNWTRNERVDMVGTDGQTERQTPAVKEIFTKIFDG